MSNYIKTALLQCRVLLDLGHHCYNLVPWKLWLCQRCKDVAGVAASVFTLRHHEPEFVT